MESFDTNGSTSTRIDVSTAALRVLPLDNKLKCRSCGYSTHNKYYLKQHISLVHRPERPFRCPFCDYAGKRSHSLKEHLIVHSAERPYECTQCDAAFRKKGHLTNHTKMHSNPAGSNCSECRLCHATFDQRSDLYGHLRTIHCLSSFRCSFCDYATTIKSNLIMHENVHADKSKIKIMSMKPKIPPGARVILKCTACGFETANERAFEVHMVDHAGAFLPGQAADSTDVPYQSNQCAVPLASVPSGRCKDCGFYSNDAYAFITHVLSHKPAQTNPSQGGTRSLFSQDALSSTFSCNICGYVCDSQRTIKSHVWKHSGHKQLEYPTFQASTLNSCVAEPLASVRKNPTSEAGSAVVHGELTARQPTIAFAASTTAESLAIGSGTVSSPSCVPCHAGTVSELHSSQKAMRTTDRSVPPETHHGTSYATPLTPDGQPPLPSTTENESAIRVQLAAVPTSIVHIDCCDKTSDSTLDSRPCPQVEQPRPLSAAEKEDSAITLLSLLKRGPNFNPACTSVAAGTVSAVAADLATPSYKLLPPPGAKRPKRGECCGSTIGKSFVAKCKAPATTSSASAVVAKPCPSSTPRRSNSSKQQNVNRRGICSTLLAVIEQLRENSDTEEVSSSSTSSYNRSPPPSSPCQVAKAVPTVVVGVCSGSSDEEPSASPVVLDSLPNVERLDTGGHRCRLCHYTTSPSAAGSALLVQHMKTHRSRQPFGCTLCDHVATSSEALQAHVITHCKMRTYQCKQCPAAFNYKSQLRAHAHVHADCSNDEQCRFPSAQLQLQHSTSTSPLVASGRLVLVSAAGGGAPSSRLCAFMCPLCNYSTLSINLLRCHLRTAHGYSEDAAGGFRCIACGAVVPTFDAVKVHSCSATGSEQVSASHFVAEQSLPNSLPSTDPRGTCDVGNPCATMKCEQCDFVALSARSLKSHLKRHLNDKRYVEQPLEQYKCNMCGYVCHHLPSLKSHMWRHASDKQYSYQSANAAINAAIDHDAGVRSSPVTRALTTYDEPSDTNGESKTTLVAFRCCHCGFETVDKALLNTHTKEHSDVIRKTLSVCVDVHS